MAGGDSLRHATPAVSGTPGNPMERDEVEKKALNLLEPVLGASKARELIDAVRHIEGVEDLRAMRPLLTV